MFFKTSLLSLCTVVLWGGAFLSASDVAVSKSSADRSPVIRSTDNASASPVAPKTTADVPFYTGGGDKPSFAKVGEVWCLVTLPPMFETVSEQVLAAPESSTCETIPAVYETISEKVLVSPARETCIKTPATYRTEEYTVTKCPARTEWREINCASVNVNADEQKGNCYGLVTIPEITETRCRQVLVTPTSFHYETIPAEYKTCEKTICVKAEARHETIIPARYETRTKEVCVSSGQQVWRLSDCSAPAIECSSCAEKKSCNSCNPCRTCNHTPVENGMQSDLQD